MSEQPRIQVLLLEGDDRDAERVRSALANLDPPVFSITWVNRLSFAQEKLAQDLPHVILTSLELTDSQGWDTVEALETAAPEVPILVLASDESQRSEMLARGADHCLDKSTARAPQLIEGIRVAVRRRRAKSQSDGALAEQAGALCDSIEESTAAILKATDFLQTTRLDSPQQDAVRMIDRMSRKAQEATVEFRNKAQ